MNEDDITPNDPLVTLRAELDQMIAMAPELARAVRGAFEAYVSEGFTDKQALYLTAVQFKDHPGPPP